MTQDNSTQTDGGDVRTNWTRTCHYNLNSDEVAWQLDEAGRAIIAQWRFKDGEEKLTYWYEPSHDQRPYRVVLPAIGFDERFQTRSDGGTANKEVLRSAKVAQELETHTCGAQTADGESCQIVVEGPEESCHLHQDETEEAEA